MDKIPSLPSLREAYSEVYFKGNTAYRDYQSDKRGLQRNFQDRIKTLLHFKPNGDLFEIGCAFGFFLECAQPYWRVRGSDISDTAVRYARDVLKLDVQEGDFEQIQVPTDSFDIVAIWDAIEHLYDPVTAIAKCSEILRAEGIVAITTGDMGAFVPRLQKKAWRMIVPEHLYYFSKRSMTLLLNRFGFDIIHLSHPGNFRSISQMAHVLTWQRPETGWRKAVLRVVEKSPIAHCGIYLNLYDIMFVIAKKNRR